MHDQEMSGALCMHHLALQGDLVASPQGREQDSNCQGFLSPPFSISRAKVQAATLTWKQMEEEVGRQNVSNIDPPEPTQALLCVRFCGARASG